MDAKERLIPLKLEENFEVKMFQNAFLVLYFSRDDSFTLTRVITLNEKKILCEEKRIKRIIIRSNVVAAYDLRETFNQKKMEGLYFLVRHKGFDEESVRSLVQAIIDTKDPVLMLEFYSHGELQTRVSKGDVWREAR